MKDLRKTKEKENRNSDAVRIYNEIIRICNIVGVDSEAQLSGSFRYYYASEELWIDEVE